jgi:hypothetical protein
MANRLIDSFQWAASGVDLQKRPGYVVNNATTHATNGRRGGRCLSITNSLTISIPTISGNVGIVGVAAKSSLNQPVISLIDVTTEQVCLKHTSDGRLQLWRGYSTALLGESLPAFIAPDTYYYYELKVTIDGANGTVDVRVNNAPVPGLSGLTGLNTRVTANDAWTGILLAGQYYCDLYVNDGSGGEDDDFWGDTRVDSHLATADGPTNEWAPSTGADHFAVVDEATPDSSDYLSTNTLDAIELFKVQDLLNAGGTIRSVMLSVLHSKTDAGSCGIKTIVRPGSTNHFGPEAYPSAGSNLYACDVLPRNPDTLALWSEAAFNASRFGFKKST